MRAALSVLAVLVMLGGLTSAAASLRVQDDGRVVLRLPGGPELRSHVFTHYGAWVWRPAGAMERTGEGRWSGTIERRPEDGPGAIAFTQTVRRLQDGLRLDYEFSRGGMADLRRGVWLAFTFPYPEFEGRRIAFSHGPPATTDDTFDVAARACTLDLADGATLRIELPRATQFGAWIEPGKSFTLNVRLVPADFQDGARARVTLRTGQPMPRPTGWRPLPSRAPLRLKRVGAPGGVVGLYEPVEFALDLSATYDNPFDPDDVEVDATFTTPGGRTEQVGGFYYQGFRAEHEDGQELLSPEGDAGWRVRYTPREVGVHRLTVRVRDRSGEVRSEPVEFRCVASDAPGFARIGDAPASGPRYFRLDGGGGSLFLIGHNVTTYPGNLAEVFERMAAGGENYTRFWMWSNALGLEWAAPVGHYRLDEAWRLDRVLELARANGIYVMLCLDTHQDFREKWSRNPYNAERGGPCTRVMDFFQSARARAAYRKRLRYVVARWGYHPNLLCWEFLNEAEGFGASGEHKDVVAGWHARMGRYLAELDPFDHPITSSLWTTEGWPELWNLPEMQIVQSHMYANDERADMAGLVAGVCAQKLRDYPGKPHVFGEYGIRSGADTAAADPTGVHLHNGNWAALASGAASNPVSWWHRQYIEPLGLYRVYGGLARYVAGEPLAERAWRPVEVESLDYVRAPDVTYRDLEFSGAQSGWKAAVPAGTRFVLGRDGSVRNLDRLPRVLHGQSHADLRSALAFEVDCPEPARFVVRVGRVSAGAALVFEVDGEAVRTVDLPAAEGLGKESEWKEQWGIWQTLYDETFGIEVPAGRHTVTLSNTGRDWIEIPWMRVEGYVTNERPALRVLGLAADDRALLWVQNVAHTWFNVRDGREMPPVPPTRLRLAGLADGPWAVELWDTRAGEVTATWPVDVQDGAVELELPAVERDVALKLLKR